MLSLAEKRVALKSYYDSKNVDPIFRRKAKHFPGQTKHFTQRVAQALRQDVKRFIEQHRRQGVFAPERYFTGIYDSKILKARLNDMAKRNGQMSGDNALPTRPRTSKTTRASQKRYGASSLHEKAAATGIPFSILKQVFDRGIAAWYTGHRPGTTAQEWAYARVDSFITMGCTAWGADADLWKQIEKLGIAESLVLSHEPTCPFSRLRAKKRYYQPRVPSSLADAFDPFGPTSHKK